jgi:hypothetical protein
MTGLTFTLPLLGIMVGLLVLLLERNRTLRAQNRAAHPTTHTAPRNAPSTPPRP